MVSTAARFYLHPSIDSNLQLEPVQDQPSPAAASELREPSRPSTLYFNHLDINRVEPAERMAYIDNPCLEMLALSKYLVDEAYRGQEEDHDDTLSWNIDRAIQRTMQPREAKLDETRDNPDDYTWSNGKKFPSRRNTGISMDPFRKNRASDNSREDKSRSEIGKDFLRAVPKFNGKNKSQFIEWILRIESAAQQIGDPEKMSPSKIALLKSEGSVFITLSNYPAGKNWEEIKRELTINYSTIPTSAHGIVALQQRKQQSDETLEEYTNEFYRLLKIVKKISPEVCNDGAVILNYSKGILSREVREKTCQNLHKFLTLLDAALYAKTQEAKIQQQYIALLGRKEHSDQDITLFEVAEEGSNGQPQYLAERLISYALRYADIHCYGCQEKGHTNNMCKNTLFLKQVEAVRKAMNQATKGAVDIKHKLEVNYPVAANSMVRIMKQLIDPVPLKNKLYKYSKRGSYPEE